MAEKCVDPATQRRYPIGVIEKAMVEAGFSVRPGKNAKSQVRSSPTLSQLPLARSVHKPQVSECIKLLQSDSNLPIQRARMRVKVLLPTVDAERLRPRILESAETVERDDSSGEQWEAVRAV